MRRPDRWYVVHTDNPNAYLVYKKYRHLKEYASEVTGIPYEDLLDVTLGELKTYMNVTRVKVKLNKKGELMSILGDVYNNLPLSELTYMD